MIDIEFRWRCYELQYRKLEQRSQMIDTQFGKTEVTEPRWSEWQTVPKVQVLDSQYREKHDEVKYET